MKPRKWLAAAVGAGLLALPAIAQEEPGELESPIIEEEERGEREAFEPQIVVEEERRERADMTGLTVLLGGGVEGYTGDLAPILNPGPAWGVSAALKPSRVLGLELRYHGAVNEVDTGITEAEVLGPGVARGPDIVRNGGSAMATFALSAAPVQPYVLGGVGIDRYTVRGPAPGLQSDTTGHIPLGAGLRTHFGDFTADARFGWNLLFNQQFAPNAQAMNVGALDTATYGRYAATLNVGATF